ncbi:MAG: DEAD/DEAH box helicase [Blautia sp.]|nr:DEAD/DEAH box helicase [Blautia sp.]
MGKTFGEIYFENIDSNEYLNSLYGDILFNYAQKVFRFNHNLKQDIRIDDALRFADILSKSSHPTKADKHRVWAQEIITMLLFLEPDNQDVRYVAGSVLSSVGNYQGKAIVKSDFDGADLLEKVFLEYKKSYYTIPVDNGKQFMRAQKIAYDHFDDEYFSYSAPTSMGKSFIMRMFIKQQIVSGERKNFALIVPTKALINEIRYKITKMDLGVMLSENRYHLVTAAGDAVLTNWKQKNQNYIFVLTPERLLYLLIHEPDIIIDYLFVDEAHKITGKDKRSPYYYQAIQILSEREKKPHFIFASPNVPNPEVYLDTIPEIEQDNGDNILTTTYSPVSQPKFIVNLVNKEVSVYNEHKEETVPITSIALEDADLIDVLLRFEKDQYGNEKPFICYFPSTRKTIIAARDFGANRIPRTDCKELVELSKDIKEEVHGDYYLADLVACGIAYHIGYLPSSIRQRIEDLFKEGKITALFCTSTLLEGVNLPADNLFITDYRNGLKDMKPIDFRNLVGRVGRLEFNLHGNVFLVALTDKATDKYAKLLEAKVEAQKLSVEKGLTKPQKMHVINNLVAGNLELPKYPIKQSDDDYELMRELSIILLDDIMKNRNSRVRREFAALMKNGEEDKIKAAFSNSKDFIKENEVTMSADQYESLYDAIAHNGLEFPKIDTNGNFDSDELWDFLIRIAKIFKWDIYESNGLGYKKGGQYKKLTWYRVVLSQWVSGYGLNMIMKEAIRHKKNNPVDAMWDEINRTYYDYKDCKEHNNIIIADVLDVIEKVVLFKISNYFLKVSNAYKEIKNVATVPNDWYEFVEYGSTNKKSIMIQKFGFSREAVIYILNHESEYVVWVNGDLKLKNSLKDCRSRAVKADFELVKYNTPELFID